MVFRKGCILPRNLSFIFDNTVLEIVNKFTYLGVVFTAGDSFKETQNILAWQSRKALFVLEKNVTTSTVSHMNDVYDKLILHILNYCSEVWRFIQASSSSVL